MNVPLETWQNLSKLANEAAEAVSRLEMAFFHAAKDADEADAKLLIKMAEEHIGDVRYVSLSYLLTTQSEWMGGEQFRMKEPHIVPGKRKFLN